MKNFESSIIFVNGILTWDIYINNKMTTYSSKQCDAVTTHCGWMMLPPQLWRP